MGRWSGMRAEVQAAQAEIGQAAEGILLAVETGLTQVAAARAGDPAALDQMDRLLCAILEACAFQDLIGQRLAKIERWLDVERSEDRGGPEAALLNGPQLHGQGLDQAAADALFGEPLP